MRPKTGLVDYFNNTEKVSGLKTFWYVGDEYLGESNTKMIDDHLPYSILYVCFSCGDPWGKIKVNDDRSQWIPIRRLCPNCGPGVLGQQNDDVYELPQKAGIREIPLMRKCKDYEIHLITGGL